MVLLAGAAHPDSSLGVEGLRALSVFPAVPTARLCFGGSGNIYLSRQMAEFTLI